MSGLESQVASLRSEGRYEEAAALLTQAGRAEEAASLLAEVWKYAEAITLVLDEKRYDLAYKYALQSGDTAQAAQVLQAIVDYPEQARVALGFAEAKGRVVDAARLLVSLGELGRAAPLFAEGGELLEAASCHEASGAYREAGKLYEKRMREAPEDGFAALRLGSILAQFGRHEPSVGALQVAEKDPRYRDAALRLMVACFHQMGMQEAAKECLLRLRAEHPALPREVESYLEIHFGEGGDASGAEAREELLAGRYRIKKQLGAGATGRVLLAHDDFYDRDVAIKVLTVGNMSAGRDAYARFAREARVAAALHHPHIVRVFEYNAEGPYLVMEVMRGGTLEDRFEAYAGRPMPFSLTRQVIKGLLDGLEAVHRRGVVHRDLKPANIFFTHSGTVKLGDFGTAHLNDLGTTMTGAMLGTLAYMAPEQITAAQAPVAATDYYACGVLLFRMLTGRLPFPGPDYLQQHLEMPVPRVSEVQPEVGVHFDDTLQAMLAKKVEDRPSSMESLRAMFDDIPWESLEGQSDSPVGKEPIPSEEQPPEAAASAPRYLTRPGQKGPDQLADDTLLERAVWRRRAPAETLEHWRRFAAADNPYLQAIFSLDESEAIVEAPTGMRLSEIQALRDGARAQAHQQIGEALKRLHRAGVVHGSLDAEHISVGPFRSVLLLPESPSTADAAADLEALDRLLSE